MKQSSKRPNLSLRTLEFHHCSFDCVEEAKETRDGETDNEQRQAGAQAAPNQAHESCVN